MSLGWEFSVQVSAVLAFHRGGVQLGSPLELLLFLPTSLPLPVSSVPPASAAAGDSCLDPWVQGRMGGAGWVLGCWGGGGADPSHDLPPLPSTPLPSLLRIASSNNLNKSESDQEDNDDINDNDWSYGSEKKGGEGSLVS